MRESKPFDRQCIHQQSSSQMCSLVIVVSMSLDGWGGPWEVSRGIVSLFLVIAQHHQAHGIYLCRRQRHSHAASLTGQTSSEEFHSSVGLLGCLTLHCPVLWWRQFDSKDLGQMHSKIGGSSARFVQYCQPVLLHLGQKYWQRGHLVGGSCQHYLDYFWGRDLVIVRVHLTGSSLFWVCVWVSGHIEWAAGCYLQMDQRYWQCSQRNVGTWEGMMNRREVQSMEIA